MHAFNAAAHRIETAAAQAALSAAGALDEAKQYAASIIGLDVHKEAIAVTVAEPGRVELEVLLGMKP